MYFYHQSETLWLVVWSMTVLFPVNASLEAESGSTSLPQIMSLRHEVELTWTVTLLLNSLLVL